MKITFEGVILEDMIADIRQFADMMRVAQNAPNANTSGQAMTPDLPAPPKKRPGRPKKVKAEKPAPPTPPASTFPETGQGLPPQLPMPPAAPQPPVPAPPIAGGPPIPTPQPPLPPAPLSPVAILDHPVGVPLPLAPAAAPAPPVPPTPAVIAAQPAPATIAVEDIQDALNYYVEHFGATEEAFEAAKNIMIEFGSENGALSEVNPQYYTAMFNRLQKDSGMTAGG